MNFKRLFYYLLINIIVSATTTLIVLSLWDRAQRPASVTPEPISFLPTAIASAFPTNTPTPQPTLALQPYEVSPGETLGEIAIQFDTSIDQLIKINRLNNPDELSSGMILMVPISPDPTEETRTSPQVTAPSETHPTPKATMPLSTLEASKIKIVTIVGIDDLGTEHLQIQNVSPEALSLEGWQLTTNDGLSYTFPKITLFEFGAVDLYTRAGINSVVALYWGQSTPVFQSGSQAVIYDAEGNVQAIYSIP